MEIVVFICAVSENKNRAIVDMKCSQLIASTENKNFPALSLPPIEANKSEIVNLKSSILSHAGFQIRRRQCKQL